MLESTHRIKTLLEYSCCTFLVAKLLYNYFCPSVRMSVRPSHFGGNVIFSAPNWVRASLLMDVFILVYPITSLINLKFLYFLLYFILIKKHAVCLYLNISLIINHYRKSCFKCMNNHTYRIFFKGMVVIWTEYREIRLDK